MSVYPFSIDDDSTLIRINDNITELGGDAINQLRSAVFNIENELGVTPSGSKDSVADRLDISLNSDGTIKASALTSVGLVTLPIDNSQVGTNAGIIESKLLLDYSTSDLNTLIQSNSTLLTSLSSFATLTDTTLNSHIAGGPDSDLRHVASHIDLNSVPSDSRDPTYVWAGLKDKDGYDLPATEVASALFQINTNLTTHQNEVNSAHDASAIAVDVSTFQELSQESLNLQEVLENIDNIEELNLGIHRATQHTNGVPNDARSVSYINPDGYSHSVVPATEIVAHVVHNPPGTVPVDSVTTGDNVISFSPTNTGFVFDAQFSQVRIGDIIRINYGNGIEDIRIVESTRFDPGSEWVVRVSGTNLRDTDGYTAFARIDRPLHDPETHGVLAVAPANATPLALFPNILGSAIVGDPNGASVLGIDFNANQIDEEHYNLYLELYPTGNPEDHVISFPAVDVSGNAGISPGSYTLDNIVQNTNNKFREIGFNGRFIAFAKDGNFGVMLADAIGGPSFAIISGSNSSGSLVEGIFSNNIVGNARSENWDALGLGFNKANLAGPVFQSTWADSTSALLPTKVIHSAKRRNYIVNGKVFDKFKNKLDSILDENDEGYYVAEISARTVTGSTVETTYRVTGLLKTVGLKAGKTIIVQPSFEIDDPDYDDADYGRFIIKEVSFSPCGVDETTITVISGIHALGSGIGFSSSPGLPVRLYFREDSVGFDSDNIIDAFPTGLNYHRNFEIYITDTKTTFSHERARMPVQAETLEVLVTENWHINAVSPRLRGYRDTGSSNLNKYVRFYVTRYDATSGEYDGYIGKRFSGAPLIEKTGPLTTSRKNVITRFYDETYVDYIDLEFIEPSTADPGLDILGSALPRYVDIELFSSLSEDDEVLLLASCEVNWEPTVGRNIVERIIDRKQHGSISESEFTDSAIEFIRSGDRLLHENGIIRGFGFTGINTAHDGELLFEGGVALVNGNIVTVNNGSIVIPQITKETAPPQDVEWAVCLNEDGKFVAVPITETKIQFYARNNITPGTNYYLQSVTFDELVLTRKDLTLVAVTTASISSISLTVSDARRFIHNQTVNIPFTWVPAITNHKETIGHFNTVAALILWINKFGSQNNTIKVRGLFSISDSIDFSSLEYPVTFEGENAELTFTSSKGFVIRQDVTFKNITFNYNPTSFSTDGIVNSDDGCIFGEASGVTPVKNINIENCRFNSESASRPPFICLRLGNDEYIDNIKIRDCYFIDNNSEIYAAIAIINTFSGTLTTYAPLVANVLIENNISNLRQPIYLTSSSISEPGLIAKNVKIRNNSIGFICYDVTDSNNINILTDGYNYNRSLTISDNQAIAVLCPISGSGTYFGSDIERATGDVSILNNNLNFIYVWANETYTGADGYGHLNISNNILRASNFETFVEDVFSTPSISCAIRVLCDSGSSAFARANTIITGNNINSDTIGNTNYYYGRGISSKKSCIVSDNIIRGLDHDGYGVYCEGFVDEILVGAQFIINNNLIHRDQSNITAYVLGESEFSSLYVTDNFFDSTVTSATSGNKYHVVCNDLSTIRRSDKWVVERNRFSQETLIITGLNGYITFGNYEFNTDGSMDDLRIARFLDTITGSSSLSGVDPAVGWYFISSKNTFTMKWMISLKDLLPNGAKVLSVATEVSSTNNSTNAGITLNLKRASVDGTILGPETDSGDFDTPYVANTVIPLSVSVTNDDYIVHKEDDHMNVWVEFSGSQSGILTISINNIVVTYRTV